MSSVSLTHSKRLSRFKRSTNEAYKIALLFQYFWNMLFDMNPIFCFGCGKYIPIHKRNADYYQTPYKNKPIHNICWDSLHSDDFVKRLNDESNLICTMDLGWVVKGSVCRSKVKNNPLSILVHMVNNHGWKTIPELVAKDNNINDTLYFEEVKQNPTIWFNDNQLTWESFRNQHFLKPNGKNFPKVRDW